MYIFLGIKNSGTLLVSHRFFQDYKHIHITPSTQTVINSYSLIPIQGHPWPLERVVNTVNSIPYHPFSTQPTITIFLPPLNSDNLLKSHKWQPYFQAQWTNTLVHILFDLSKLFLTVHYFFILNSYHLTFEIPLSSCWSFLPISFFNCSVSVSLLCGLLLAKAHLPGIIVHFLFVLSHPIPSHHHRQLYPVWLHQNSYL